MRFLAIFLAVLLFLSTFAAGVMTAEERLKELREKRFLRPESFRRHEMDKDAARHAARDFAKEDSKEETREEMKKRFLEMHREQRRERHLRFQKNEPENQ